MAKQFSKITALSTAAVLASSALVPVAASAAEASEQITHVVFTTESGNLASLPMGDYNAALSAGVIKVKASHIQLGDGTVYNMSDYDAALSASKTVEEAIKLIKEHEEPVTGEVKPGEVQDGKVIIEDEQSEDRLNETLIYNFAA